MNPASRADVDLLRELEEGLWRAVTRFDLAWMRRVLAPDFVEIGRSSRIYGLDDTLAATAREIGARLPLPDFAVRLVHPDVALVTYTSDVATTTGREHARRSSLWTRAGTGWRLRFHQGTPIPDGEIAS